MKPEEIVALREKLGLSQTEFGQLLGGVPQKNVSRWETGAFRPNKFHRAILRMVADNAAKGEYTPDFLARISLGFVAGKPITITAQGE
jgi:predicted transcriptional regulator